MGYYRDFEYTVYVIRRVRDGLPLYVGQTITPLKQRLSKHLIDAKNRTGPVSAWLRWLRDNRGEELEIVGLATGKGVSLDAHAKEREIIEAYMDKGIRLLNSNNGVTQVLRTREGTFAPIPRLTGLSGLLTVF